MKRIAPASPRPAGILDRLRFSSEGLLWLFVAAIVGFLGWWKTINIVYLLASVMLALLVVNGVMARLHAGRIQVAPQPVPPVYSGETFTAQSLVTNRGRWRATVMITEEIEGKSQHTLITDLAAQAATSCAARWGQLKRGYHHGHIRVASGYPLGLISIAMPVVSRPIAVLPALGTINPDGLRRWVLRRGSHEDRNSRALRFLTSDQADVRGVRPYRPGDSIKTIHWRSSAHRGELMVREYDALRVAGLVLVVEPWLPLRATTGDQDNLEEALSLAATIAVRWTALFEARVTIVLAGDGESLRSAAPSDFGIREALAPLARTVGAHAFEPLEADAFDQSLASVVRLVVSTRPDSPYASLLARTTGRRFIALSPLDRLPWYEPPTRDEREGD